MITVDAVPVVYPFLNPLTDFGFKHLFGTDANKDLLISFLNALFKGEKKIVDVTYRPTEHTGDEETFKNYTLTLPVQQIMVSSSLLKCSGRNNSISGIDVFFIYQDRSRNKLLPEDVGRNL
ncbi:PD-(D/E)XK nuclease family transposase [Pedobacter polysacchareus]|uniref:PD-(D/E)XK nuclease family transposase n=1 Tax=Pedobacter polysacchareus TaxID=2861973 RepID=UPI001C99383F|nr:PD-(D/E)XK nuclease family transposase [Pedobacter polysacchareus]